MKPGGVLACEGSLARCLNAA